jgi:hypothetical protein
VLAAEELKEDKNGTEPLVWIVIGSVLDKKPNGIFAS